MKIEKLLAIPFSEMAAVYTQKVERKGRNAEDLWRIFTWLSGFSQAELEAKMQTPFTFGEFFATAPHFHPAADSIKGRVCGMDIQTIADPDMRKVRILDKLVDDLAKGRAWEKIFLEEKSILDD